MPHSGGGGSSAGGSVSSSRPVPKLRISATPFINAIAFAVYDRHGRSHLVYTDSEDYKEEKVNLFGPIMITILGIICLCAVGLLLWGFAYTSSQTRPSDNPLPVEIIDSYDLVTPEEEKALKESLESFRDQTNITPAVEFTTKDAWAGQYSEIADYAYDQYLQLFDDEKHLLLTYSYGDESDPADTQKFEWNSMWGDGLKSVAGAEDENWLAENMQTQLMSARGENVPSVMANVFQNFIQEMQNSNRTMKLIELGGAVFFLVLGVPMVIFGLKWTREAKAKDKQYKADGVKTYRITGEPQALQCPSCGCTYYKGTVTTCPKCGAPVNGE